MKKLLAIISLLAAPLLASDLDYAYRLPAELQTPGPVALEKLTWQQGSTPLIQVEVLSHGQPVTADANTTVRMIIGPSATGTYYAVTNQYLATNTSYYIQWPTIGTNSLGTNSTPQAWWYTIYFERNGHRYWTGNGDLYIERTTSTDADGLVWQTLTTGSIAWGDIVGVWTNLSQFNNDLAGLSTNLSAFNNDAGFVTASVTNGVNSRIDGLTNGAALGLTALQTLPLTNDLIAATNAIDTRLTAHTTNTANPHATTAAQVGAVSTNDTKYLAALTNEPIAEAGSSAWYKASTDASSATGTIAVIQLSTGAWTKAASDAETATNAIPRVTELEGRTNVWNAGATDASAATNETAALRGATNSLNTRVGAIESATNAINTRVSALETPYQSWVSIIPDAGATATVSYASGPLVEIIATNSPTTITFDNSAYPTSGVCAVNVEIYAGTNSIAFVSETITNSAAPTISTSDWTSIFYRKVGTNILWKGRN